MKIFVPGIGELYRKSDCWTSIQNYDKFSGIEIEVPKEPEDETINPELMPVFLEVIRNLGRFVAHSQNFLLQMLKLGISIPPDAVARLYPVPPRADEMTVKTYIRDYFSGFLKSTYESGDWSCIFIRIGKSREITIAWQDENAPYIEWFIEFKDGKPKRAFAQNI